MASLGLSYTFHLRCILADGVMMLDLKVRSAICSTRVRFVDLSHHKFEFTEMTRVARAARLSLQTLPGREVGEDVDELEAPAARGVAALAVVVDHLEAGEGALQDLWGMQQLSIHI